MRKNADRPTPKRAEKDFGRVGFHIDLRIQVLPLPALKSAAREAANLGLNTLLIEWEAAYPFVKHPLITSALAYTPAEIEYFIAYSQRLGLDVIPLQQCFGHIEYILRHERYANLRESETDLCQLCPCKAREALELFGELFGEIAQKHPSPYLHIGGDETYLLGHCPECRKKAEKQGKSRLYVDYFKRIAKAVIQLGKRPLLWADMLLKYPEAASLMPRECVFIDWNYGWPPNQFGDPALIDRRRFKLWGAPALRSSPDNHSLTCWKTHFENLKEFIPYARKSNYTGMILTSWSTSGIYCHQWDKPGEIIRLLPVRRVYPLAGFRILLVAFQNALGASEDFEPENFVIEYAHERFGLSTRDGARLWRALNMDALPLSKDSDYKEALRQARQAQRTLHSLKPVRQHREFEHLRLMCDLREFHTRYKAWEARLHTSAFTSGRLATARTQSTALIKESEALAGRFEHLNRKELYPSEFAEEHAYRFGKIRELHARLTRQRKV